MRDGALGNLDRHDDLARRLAGQTLSAAQQFGLGLLRPLDTEGAAADARRLLIAAIGGDPLELVRQPERPLSAGEVITYAAALGRRVRGEPVSRILGVRGFYGRDFVITPDVLDPRPESETLIDAALELVGPRWPGGAGLDIIDIGVGSGCLLVTLLAELPAATGVGVDPSSAALAVAAANADRHGVSTRFTTVNGRAFGDLERSFPLIISNPPYIPNADIDGLAREVRDHDPRLALDGGVDGLDIYRSIAHVLPKHAAPGWVLFEVGDGQAETVGALLRAALPSGRLGRLRTYRDMAGKQRCVAAEIQH